MGTVTLEATAVFRGIGNENEFFGQHYLAEVFSGDIRERLEAWAALEEATGPDAEVRGNRRRRGWRAPQHVLLGLGAAWARARRDLETVKGRDEIVDAFGRLQQPLLDALGYSIAPEEVTLTDGYPFHAWARAGRDSHAPRLIVVPAVPFDATDGDVLEQPVDLAIFPGAPPAHAKDATWADWVSDGIFAADDPPRFVLLLGSDDWLLLDRLKWPNNRVLRFTWPDILDRHNVTSIAATAALLHRESLAPDEGAPLLDGLDKRAHKHAFGVSQDLKYALREAIELLGNEAARQLRERAESQKRSVFSGRAELDAEQLSLECLRLMYRLLFVFYIEARPELGYVPVGDETYLKGYSLEALRDLELVQLQTSRARDGLFLDDSLRRLFRLIHDGSGAAAAPHLGDVARVMRDAFALAPLDSRLFDPASTPLLNEVRFPNHLWQRIIELLSLTGAQKGRGRRGRVSYQLLSINELGAVYEALLSFRGFFAKEDLFEVQPAPKNSRRAVEEPEGTEEQDEEEDEPRDREKAWVSASGPSRRDDLEVGWFVPHSQLGDYEDDEKVYVIENGHRKLRSYSKGTFIYRLAGRDREKSASYYTPQVLTQCLVKYALKELLREGKNDELKADDLLRLTVVEPAMGSAAFLNEAVNQLAEKYLQKKQAELDRRIPHDQYQRELQKVRMYLADRNVFGVDLNPIAVELAEVSLWLNAIYGEGPDATGRPTPARVPWFGYQLFDGNSLVGARAEVYAASGLAKGARPAWHEQAPGRLNPEKPERRDDEIYHFLLPDPAMSNYTDKVARALYPAQFEQLKAWRKKFCAPLQEHEIGRLQQLSKRIDALWEEHAAWLERDRKATEDKLSVWPATGEGDTVTTREQKDAVRRKGLLNEDGDEATPYRRLKLVMDYWCALWFWPIRQSATLPTREAWWLEVGAILEGSMVDVGAEPSLPFDATAGDEPVGSRAQQLLPEMEPQPSLRMTSGEPDLHDRLGRLRITKLRDVFPRIADVERIAGGRRFFHWELTFADIFRSRGGFDLVLGNPPWIKVEWNESGVLGDVNPLFAVRKISASDLAKLRSDAFACFPGLDEEWTTELEESEGTQAFLNADQNYPLLRGVQTNLYKCFLPTAWRTLSRTGITGLVHPEGTYDDPKGGALRASLYPRLRAHFQFQNEFQLFTGTNDHGRLRFGLHVYGQSSPSVAFDHMCNLFTPSTIDASYAHDGSTELGGIKSPEGRWNTEGHRERIVRVDDQMLAVFASLYDAPGTPPRQARLPSLHASSLSGVLEKFAAYPRRLADLGDRYFSTEMWHETMQQKDGTIVRRKAGDNRFPADASEWILSGPHFQVGNPFNKTPRRVCTANGHYDVIDLESLPENYLPRTNYWPMKDREEYARRTPNVSWVDSETSSSNPVTSYPRALLRKRLAQSGDRTLVVSLVPPDVSHVINCVSLSFRQSDIMIRVLGAMSSIVCDFFLKSTGWSDITANVVRLFPYAEASPALDCRVLALNCLTAAYRPIWESCFNRLFCDQTWSREGPGLSRTFFSSLTRSWGRHSALRSDYARRMALVELDVMFAQQMRLSADDLVLIYRIQFPVMRQYERDTWYDTKGRIVFTVSKGLIGVGLPRKGSPGAPPTRLHYPDGVTKSGNHGWEDVRNVPDGTVVEQEVMDDTLPNGPHKRTRRWVAPFTTANREEDYRIAWEYFASMRAGQVSADGNVR